MFSKLFTEKNTIHPVNLFKEEEEKKKSNIYFVRLHKLYTYYLSRDVEIESFEDFLKRGDLLVEEELPKNSIKIYVSHEWVGTKCADPKGVQIKHLLNMLKRLESGDVANVSMDPFQRIIFKQEKYTTSREEWIHILSRRDVFIWYDWFCVPRANSNQARLISKIVERVSFSIILTPPAKHTTRKDPATKRNVNLCYRTYRLQARYVFDMFANFLSTRGGERSQPMLLIRSALVNPMWISPMECLKLSVGHSTFRCFEDNHTIMTECTRRSTRRVLKSLVQSRATSLFENAHHTEARLTLCLEQWWTRGFEHDDDDDGTDDLKTFVDKQMRWNKNVDMEWFDREGWGVLTYVSLSLSFSLYLSLSLSLTHVRMSFKKIRYAVISNKFEITKTLLDRVIKVDEKRRKVLLKSSTPRHGCAALSIPGSASIVCAAAAFASLKVLRLLLERGADPYDVDSLGNDALMFASMMGRDEIATFWLQRKLNGCSKTFGRGKRIFMLRAKPCKRSRMCQVPGQRDSCENDKEEGKISLCDSINSPRPSMFMSKV